MAIGIAGVSFFIASFTAVYGCMKIDRKSNLRYLLYIGVSLFVILFTWVPMTNIIGFRVLSQEEQWIGASIVAVTLKPLMEYVVPKIIVNVVK